MRSLLLEYVLSESVKQRQKQNIRLSDEIQSALSIHPILLRRRPSSEFVTRAGLLVRGVGGAALYIQELKTYLRTCDACVHLHGHIYLSFMHLYGHICLSFRHFYRQIYL